MCLLDGYENNEASNEESFFSVKGHGDGWFNTGDTGYVDSQGFLFISGRSKEIINRGGETISPFEIEEAIVQHPFIKETVAFSAPHAEYQETIGAWIVSKPDKPRVDLPLLHKYLESRLHRSKWPQVIIYSDALPKNAANKVLRIKLAERCNLPTVDEELPPKARIFSAVCPPIGTPLNVPISIDPVKLDYDKAKEFILSQPDVAQVAFVEIDLPSHNDAIVAFLVPVQSIPQKSDQALQLVESIRIACDEQLDHYITPSLIYTIESIPFLLDSQFVDTATLKELAITCYQKENIVEPRNETEREVEIIWRSMLCSSSVLSVTASFFDLGGDSLKAGRVIGAMRQQLKLPLNVADLFAAGTIEAMAAKITSMRMDENLKDGGRSPFSIDGARSAHMYLHNSIRKLIMNEYHAVATDEDDHHNDSQETSHPDRVSSTSFVCLFVQLLPTVLFYPIRRISGWLCLAALWVSIKKAGLNQLQGLVAAIIINHAIFDIIGPLLGILAKWLIVGRYKPGKYPLWGSMYLKWWIVDQIINIMGKGIFTSDLPIIGSQLLRYYYIMLGATIGKNVKISKDAKLGHADMITIEDNVVIDSCIMTSFTLETVSVLPSYIFSLSMYQTKPEYCVTLPKLGMFSAASNYNPVEFKYWSQEYYSPRCSNSGKYSHWSIVIQLGM